MDCHIFPTPFALAMQTLVSDWKNAVNHGSLIEQRDSYFLFLLWACLYVIERAHKHPGD